MLDLCKVYFTFGKSNFTIYEITISIFLQKQADRLLLYNRLHAFNGS
jgi:hypothetical protein